MIFDTHVHYDDKAFHKDREVLLELVKNSGIEAVTNIGADIESSRRTLELTQRYPWIYGALGVHPSETGSLTEADIQWLKEAADSPKIVAIGEIGLDYYWDKPDREIQKKWFVRQLDLAREIKLPVVIHSRDAARDTLEIMKSENANEIGGVIHCFSYSLESAREFLKLGFYLGIGGVVTFHNAKKLKEVVEYMPMDRIVLETDCPYLSPVPNRGKRNSSLNLPYIVDEISEIKKIPPEEVIKITNQNAKSLYSLV